MIESYALACRGHRPPRSEANAIPARNAIGFRAGRVFQSVDARTEEDWTSGTLSTAATYDIAYTYDQLGNRQTKVDAVSGQWVVYDYDVDVADPNTLDYPTWHNRLLEYRMYDRDPNDPNTILLRTVSYTYYKTGQASNITVKDEDPDPDPVNGPDPAYDVYHDLALYYHSHGPLWRALWGSYTLDQSGDPTGYETSWAREFFYDSPRQRFLAADYDTNGYDDEPDRWTWNTGLWTEYSGELPYADLETTRYLPDEQNHPHQHAYTRTETLHYLGTAAQQTTDTPPETAFHHGDLIGSTNLTTDNSGNANQTSAVAYTAFGETIGDASTLATRYQYAGRFGYESDLLAVSGINSNLADITLQHVGHRWYQPDIGRFVQRDPIGVFGGTNVFSYVFNRPTKLIDPLGLAAPKWTDGLPTPPKSVVDWIGASGLAGAGGSIGGTVAGGAVATATGAGLGAALGAWVWFGGKAVCIQVGDLLDTWSDLSDKKAKNRKQREDNPDTFPPPEPMGPGGEPSRGACAYEYYAICFAAETLVHTGASCRRIDQLDADHDVLSTQYPGAPSLRSRILRINQNGCVSRTTGIEVAGETIRCTGEHPFWVDGKGWVPAMKLRPGDLLLAMDGALVKIDRVHEYDHSQPVAVYDVQCESGLYYVGHRGILVHSHCVPVDHTRARSHSLEEGAHSDVQYTGSPGVR